jgi:hypothetical protein
MRTAAILTTIIGVALGATVADARMSVVYDTTYDTRLLAGVQPDGAPGLGPSDGFLQQQPAVAVLPPSAQAWKVQGRASTPTTPGLAGRDAAGIVRLLTDRIRRSGAHTVFIDEIASNMGRDTARALADALGTLRETPSPWGGSYADRVHLYVPAPAFLLRDPAGWEGAWRAMARAGGVWLQTYRSPVPTTPWQAPEWLTWPRAVGERVAAAGGSPDRLHLLMSTHPDQAMQWQNARTGAACAWLSNGPGAYRLDGSVSQWVAQFRATFGPGPAPAGPSPVACAPPPMPDAARSHTLASVLAWGSPDMPPRPAPTTPRQLVIGATSTLRIAPGLDPAGVAGALGIPVSTLRSVGRPRIVVRGPGFSRVVALAGREAITVRVRPMGSGPVGISVVLNGAALTRTWAGGDIDVLATIDAGGGAPTARQAAAVDPRSWALGIPIGPPPAVVAARPTRLGLARMGTLRARRAGIDTRRVDGWIATVRDQAGRRMAAGIPLTARLPTGRGARVRTGKGGMAVIRVPRRAGRLTVRVALPGPPVLARRTITTSSR